MWTVSSVIIYGSALVISYLRSKPPLSHTVMDYANEIFFICYIPSSIFLSIYITLAIVLIDSGEVAAALIGYSVPACGEITFTQLCAIFIIQAMLVKNPQYLNNEKFETMIKFGMAIIIPVSIGVIYTTLYFCFKPLGHYSTLREIEDHNVHQYWLGLKLGINLPLGIASAVSLLRTMRILQNNSIQSNHILSTKEVLLTVIGLMLIAAFAYTLIYIFLVESTTIMLPVLINTLKCVFVITVVFSHPSIRNHVSTQFLIRNIVILWSVRQARQTDDIELHGVSNQRQTNGMYS